MERPTGGWHLFGICSCSCGTRLRQSKEGAAATMLQTAKSDARGTTGPGRFRTIGRFPCDWPAGTRAACKAAHAMPTRGTTREGTAVTEPRTASGQQKA